MPSGKSIKFFFFLLKSNEKASAGSQERTVIFKKTGQVFLFKAVLKKRVGKGIRNTQIKFLSLYRQGIFTDKARLVSLHYLQRQNRFKHGFPCPNTDFHFRYLNPYPCTYLHHDPILHSSTLNLFLKGDNNNK